MTSAAAEMLLYAITAVAVAVWAGGLQFLVATVRKGKKGVDDFAKYDDPPPANLIYGSAEIDGAAAELLQKAAAILAAKSVRISKRTDETIDFETPREIIPGQNFNLPPNHGQLRFTPLAPQKTRIDYAVARPRMRVLLILGLVFEALGFAAIVAGFLLIYFLVVPSPNPEVRWQTLQMLQVCHFLWPPFMFAGIYRKTSSFVKANLETFVHNLPFLTA